MPTQDFYVGCRMLIAPQKGFMQQIDHARIASLLQHHESIVDIAVTKPLHTTVTNLLQDNSDFMGYLVCKHPDVAGLLKALDKYENQVLACIRIGETPLLCA